MAMKRVEAHLKHLGRDDYRLADNVALCNHHLLCQENLAGRDLDTKVTTSNHDTVRLFQDLVEVGNTLLVLNFNNNLDVGTIGSKNGADVPDVLPAADKRRKNHINPILNTKLEILFVLIGERR